MKDSKGLWRYLNLISQGFLPAQQRYLLSCGLGCLWLQCCENKGKGQRFYLLVPASCRDDYGKGSRDGMRSLVWHCLSFSIPFCTVRVSGSDNSWHAILNWVRSQGPFQQKLSGWKAQTLDDDGKLSRIINESDGTSYRKLWHYCGLGD